MTVQWRNDHGTDAIVLLDNSSASVISQVPSPDETDLKSYLSVTGDLEMWRGAMRWRQVEDASRNPETWGNLVLSRDDAGDVTFVDPELFWDGVYRWFRSRGVDYN
jgi:hypothetical protein